MTHITVITLTKKNKATELKQDFIFLVLLFLWYHHMASFVNHVKFEWNWGIRRFDVAKTKWEN